MEDLVVQRMHDTWLYLRNNWLRGPSDGVAEPVLVQWLLVTNNLHYHCTGFLYCSYIPDLVRSVSNQSSSHEDED